MQVSKREAEQHLAAGPRGRSSLVGAPGSTPGSRTGQEGKQSTTSYKNSEEQW